MTTHKTILIIEDDDSMLRVLIDKFSREGFTVLTAKDGVKGLRLALKQQPDLILLDIILPKLDGLSMLQQLRSENFYGKSVPVILLTNLSADREDINRAVAKTEPAYYLVKTNWTLQDVVAKVKERLGRD